MTGRRLSLRLSKVASLPALDREPFLAADLEQTKARYAEGEISLAEFEELAARTVRYQQNALESRLGVREDLTG